MKLFAVLCVAAVALAAPMEPAEGSKAATPAEAAKAVESPKAAAPAAEAPKAAAPAVAPKAAESPKAAAGAQAPKAAAGAEAPKAAASAKPAAAAEAPKAAASPKAGAAPPKAAAAPKAGNGTATACAQAQTDLEKGIQKNLDIQAQELKGVQDLQAMMTAMQKKAQDVLKIQQQGIDIRTKNSALAKQINSSAADGLAIVAGAQVKEMTQVQGIETGGGDAKVLKQLVQEVQDGTKQNQKNLAAAKSQQCAAK